VAAGGLLDAQQRRPARRAAKPAPKPSPTPTPKVEPATLRCPTPLGVGVKTKREFCDVLIGRDLKAGVVIEIPPHSGAATLSLDLHNRHTYSEEEVRAKRAYAQYTATVGAYTPEGGLIARLIVRSEFRRREDLLDRVSGGAGPSGVKAVSPVGTEPVVIEIPEGVEQAVLLGERLVVSSVDGPATYSLPGRPAAVLSNVRIEYTPVPPAKRPATPRAPS
jgi:hypothetical protein